VADQACGWDGGEDRAGSVGGGDSLNGVTYLMITGGRTASGGIACIVDSSVFTLTAPSHEHGSCHN
jgi:hypothetical protein